MRFCTICEKFIETDGMQLLKQEHGRAVFYDQKANLVHVVLSEKRSQAFKPTFCGTCGGEVCDEPPSTIHVVIGRGR